MIYSPIRHSYEIHMMLLSFILCSLTILSLADVGEGAGVNECPQHTGLQSDHMFTYRNLCYYFHVPHNRDQLSRDLAEKACESSFGTLASVKDEYVNTFLADTLRKLGVKGAWIGFSEGQNGEMKWEDGSSVEYENFNVSDVYSLHHTCASLDDGGDWSRHECSPTGSENDVKFSYICEFPKLGATFSRADDDVIKEDITQSSKSNFCPKSSRIDESHMYIFNDFCYYFFMSDVRNRNDAEISCEYHGGTLANPKTSEINEFLMEKLVTNFSNEKVWIGLGEYSNGDRGWADDSGFDPSKFTQISDDPAFPAGMYLPSESGEEKFQGCGALDREGHWHWYRCDSNYDFFIPGFDALLSYICEYPNTPPPSPAPTSTPNPTETTPATTPTANPSQIISQIIKTPCVFKCTLNCDMNGYKTAPDGCALCECDSDD